jgi:hypothetical protein
MPPVQGYDEKKDTPMPIGLARAHVCGLTQWAVVVFKKLNCYKIFKIIQETALDSESQSLMYNGGKNETLF